MLPRDASGGSDGGWKAGGGGVIKTSGGLEQQNVLYVLHSGTKGSGWFWRGVAGA